MNVSPSAESEELGVSTQLKVMCVHACGGACEDTHHRAVGRTQPTLDCL